MKRVLPPFFVALIAACASTKIPEASSYTEKLQGTSVSFEMARVPGSGNVKSFWLGKTEVTWDEYEQFYLRKDTVPELDAISKPSPSYEPYDRGWGGGKRPAVGVSLNAAKIYCEWLSKKTGHHYRLPTEAEWELACASSDPNEAWSQENSEEKTQPVAAKKPNALGLYDMLGNAWEYCADTEDGLPVLRGGSWKDAKASLSPKARILFNPEWIERDPQRPRSKWWVVDGPFLGFRVARDGD